MCKHARLQRFSFSLRFERSITIDGGCQDAPKLNKKISPADTIPEARISLHHNSRKVHQRPAYYIENEGGRWIIGADQSLITCSERVGIVTPTN